MSLKPLIKILKPFRLISLLTTYILGLGLVQYVRDLNSWPFALQGGLFLVLVTLGMEALGLMGTLTRQGSAKDSLNEKERLQQRILLAIFAATCLTVATTLLIGWMVRGALWQGWTVLILATLIGAAFNYLTQVSPAFSTYKILAEVILFVIIPPALAFFIQSKEFHRLLTLTVIPFVAAYFPYPLLLALREFGRDQKSGKKTVATEFGWERTMVFHNALILLAYLLFALIALLEFPWFLIWPVFLTLPIGILEVWLMERVRRGGKPLWRVMQFATASIYFLPMYLVAFAFWTR